LIFTCARDRLAVPQGFDVLLLSDLLAIAVLHDLYVHSQLATYCRQISVHSSTQMMVLECTQTHL
jgi:hypothetical protein